MLGCSSSVAWLICMILEAPCDVSLGPYQASMDKLTFVFKFAVHVFKTKVLFELWQIIDELAKGGIIVEIVF